MWASAVHAQPNLILTAFLWNRYYKLHFGDKETAAQQVSKLLVVTKLVRTQGWRKKYLRWRPKVFRLQSLGFGQGAWLSQWALLVWCWVGNSIKTAFWWRKVILKITDPSIALNLTLTAVGKVYIKESSHPFSLEQKKKDLMNVISSQFTWVNRGKQEAFLAAKDKVQRPPSSAATLTPSGQVSPPQDLSESPPTAPGGRPSTSLRLSGWVCWGGQNCWERNNHWVEIAARRVHFCSHQKANTAAGNWWQS